MKIKKGTVREFLVALIIFVCIMGVVGTILAYATEIDSGEELYDYNILEDETIEIIGYLGEETEVNIPEKIEGMTVTSIAGYSFSNCEKITKITIPNSVTSIGILAFSYCSSLTSITLPEDLINIEDRINMLKIYENRDLVC